MRLGPILVPSTIVVAIGVIVAAQSDWFEGGASEPTFLVHDARASRGTPSTSDPKPHGAIAASTAGSPASPAEDMEPTSVGRSVGKNADAARPTFAGAALGTGGASLDSDGDGSGAVPSDRAAAAAPDPLQQARDEAAKAKQDVLDVTQASIASQHASEAEFERQKAELTEQIAQMRAKLDATPAQPAGSNANAEARAATAMAELTDARERENALRAKLAAAQAAGSDEAARKDAADKLAAAERARSEAQGRARDLEGRVAALQADVAAGKGAADKAAGDKLAAAEHARTAAQDRVGQLETEVAALQAGAAAGKVAEDKLATAERAVAEAKAGARTSADKVAALETEVATKAATERDLADTQALAKDLGSKVDALQATLAASKSAASLVVARADAADRLESDLEAARKRDDALERRVATLQGDTAKAALAQNAEATAVRKASALQQQLDAARLREQDLKVTLAALQSGAAEGEARAKQAQSSAAQAAALRQELAASEGREKDLGNKLAALQQEARAGGGVKAPGMQTPTSLQADLAGARRGEDILRRENGVLQRELTSQRTATKLLAEKLAALQVGMGQPVPPDRTHRHGRAETSSRTGDHERLVDELAALRREQMHQELEGLRVEAASLGHSRRGRRQVVQGPDNGARVAASSPDPETRLTPVQRRAARRRDRQALREREAAFGRPPSGPGTSRFSALRKPAAGADDSSGAIAQAGSLIRSGDIDQARQVLRNRGGAAATRALADTYNPLTNTKYGALGVDSDAEKAASLYEQADRSSR